MFTHWSAWTCCVDGRRLLRLQNRLEMMASTRDEFNSESGSNVFSPFSLKDSMMFQMSTRDTEIKQEWNNQDLPEISIKNFLNGWQLDIKTQLQPIYLQQIHFYSGISFIFSFLNLYAVHVLIRCNKLNQNCSFFALLYEVFLCFKKVCDESCLRDSNLYKLLVLVCIVN